MYLGCDEVYMSGLYEFYYNMVRVCLEHKYVNLW